MKVALPIAALLAILIAAGSTAVPGEPIPTDRYLVGPAQDTAVPYSVAFDPFTGLGMTDNALDHAPEPAAIRFEIGPDLFDHGADTAELYPVDVLYPPLVPQPQSFAAMRALHDPEPLSAEPVAVATATDAWWDTPPPLDAK